MQKTTRSAAETKQFARTLAKKSRGGDMYCLVGDLGSGKTTFAQGFAAGLGIARPVASPTFILMNIYPVTGHPGASHFCHIDTYRVADPADMADVGIHEWLQRPDTVTLIEWADRIADMLRGYAYTEIRFALTPQNGRQLTLRRYQPTR